MLVFDAAQFDGILKKISEFNLFLPKKVFLSDSVNLFLFFCWYFYLLFMIACSFLLSLLSWVQWAYLVGNRLDSLVNLLKSTNYLLQTKLIFQQNTQPLISNKLMDDWERNNDNQYPPLQFWKFSFGFFLYSFEINVLSLR